MAELRRLVEETLRLDPRPNVYKVRADEKKAALTSMLRQPVNRPD